MKAFHFLFAVSVASLAFMTAIPAAQQPASAPVAKKVPRETKIHGYTLKDDYFWMREKSNAEVTKYLEAENAYTEAVMAPRKALQETLYKEMLGRIKQTDLSVPARNGDYWYYSRTEEGKQYPYMCRRKGTMEGQEEILLDLNKLAEGHKFLGLGGYSVSDDANWLAFSMDTTGYRQFTLRVKDLRTGALSSESIERVGSIVWANDNKTLFFTTEDAVTKRSDKFWRHVVGTDKNDLVLEEKRRAVRSRRRRDRSTGRYCSSGAYAKTSREIRYLPADNPTGAFKIVVPREEGHEYDVDHYEGRFYITTNKGAKNFKVVTAPMSDPSEKNWTPFIPHTPTIKVEGLTFFKNHLVVSEREGGLNYLRVIDMRDKKSHRIATDEPDYAMGLGANPEFDTSFHPLRVSVDGDARLRCTSTTSTRRNGSC